MNDSGNVVCILNNIVVYLDQAVWKMQRRFRIWNARTVTNLNTLAVQQIFLLETCVMYMYPAYHLQNNANKKNVLIFWYNVRTYRI